MSHEMRAAASTGMFTSSETERAARVEELEVPAMTRGSVPGLGQAQAQERIAGEGGLASGGYGQADNKRLV